MKIRKIFKGIIVFLLSYLVLVLALFALDIIWISPPYYEVTKYDSLSVPIMTMEEYNEIVMSHPRPYYFSVESNKGAAYIIGVDHTNDQSHPHLDSIKAKWKIVNPTVALVESRMGFLFTWTQDPIDKYGERGLTARLAKANNCDLYTWEPKRVDEISYFLNKYSAEQLAVFYVLRPYFSYHPNYRKEHSHQLVNKLIKERTNYSGLKDQIHTWADVDKIINRDFPSLKWEMFDPSKGWPEGYLSEIFNDSNLFRDRHMIQLIVELVDQGESVFVTMGASHAPRIENTLKYELLNN